MDQSHSSYSLTYDHIGIPTKERSDDEVYSADFHAHSWRAGNDSLRIEKVRFDANAPFPDDIRNRPHIAFKVDSLEKAVTGKKLLVPITEQKPGIQFAFVDIEGVLIEFFQIG